MDLAEHSLLCCEELNFNASPSANNDFLISSSSALYNTDEEYNSSTSTSPSPSNSSSLLLHHHHGHEHGNASTFGGFTPFSFPGDGDDELSIDFLQKKYSDYFPKRGIYSSELRSKPQLSEFRCNAIRWIIKAHFILAFSPLTTTLAVNYMDRYIENNLTMSWKPWMMELLAVACLSVAAKMEEVDVPILLDLQTDGMEHLFQPKTVQRMELNVLSSLGWRLRSITSYTFVEKGINHLPDLNQNLKSSLMVRASELLLATLAEAEFLDFEPFVVAVTTICCALEEVLPVQADHLKILIINYIPLDVENLRSCYVLMESLIVDPLSSSPTLTLRGRHFKFPLSPNTVLYYNLTDQENSSVDYNSSRCNPFHLKLDSLETIEDCDSNPYKRQRRY